MLQIMSDYALRYPNYSQPLVLFRTKILNNYYTQCLLYCNINEHSNSLGGNYPVDK